MYPKYIVVLEGGSELAIVIPAWHNHVDHASGWEVISAGCFSIGHDHKMLECVRVHCFGESVSLGKKSRDAIDEKLIEYLLGLS